MAIRFASQELLEDRKFWFEALKRGGQLRDLPNEARHDRDVVLAAVARGRDDFKFAPPQLREDPEIVLAATSKNAGLWGCVAKRLRADPSLMLTALRRNPRNSQHLILQGEARHRVMGAAESKLAEKGEEGAPVVIAELTMSEGAIECSLSFASGRSLEFTVGETATVGDLAAKVVSNRPDGMKAFQRIFFGHRRSDSEGRRRGRHENDALGVPPPPPRVPSGQEGASGLRPILRIGQAPQGFRG